MAQLSEAVPLKELPSRLHAAAFTGSGAGRKLVSHSTKSKSSQWQFRLRPPNPAAPSQPQPPRFPSSALSKPHRHLQPQAPTGRQGGYCDFSPSAHPAAATTAATSATADGKPGPRDPALEHGPAVLHGQA